MNFHRNRVCWVASVSFGLLAAVSAQAAELQKVTQSDWQGGVSLPSYMNMYLYVPDNLATKPPILVASHHCQGTGTTTYNETKSTFVSQADKNGYIIIYPEATGHNCWDVGSAKALAHDGGGDTHAVAQMVKHTIAKYNADAARVYAFGGSSGGMMTQALLGIYPDIFMAGVSISGVPCGCWAVGYTGDVATDGQWSGSCAGGTVTKTAQAWGDLVRSMYPSYTGHRARLQLWHGDPDSVISFVNFGEAIKEWTNVLGLSATPTKTESPSTSTTHQTWNNTCGVKVLETFAIKGAAHAVQWDIATASSFLGLDKAGGQDPEIIACSGAGGVGGASGAAGAAAGVASGGVGASGTKAAGGSGVGGSVTGGVSTSGGSDGVGGLTTGGARATGGTSFSTSTGGALSEGGLNAVGGKSSGGAAAANGGVVATGGAPSNGGNAVQGGNVSARSGGAPASGGSTLPSNGGAVTGTVAEGDSPSGCSCALPGLGSSGLSGKLAGFLLSALAMRLHRRKRHAA